jgi:hypothetical protein
MDVFAVTHALYLVDVLCVQQRIQLLFWYVHLPGQHC